MCCCSAAQDPVEALAFSLSMGVARSCPQEFCESTSPAPQIIVAEKVVSYGLEQGDLEQVQVQEVPVESTGIYVTARTTSKIKRSLLLEKKLHTDTEIMRGASAASLLGVVFFLLAWLRDKRVCHRSGSDVHVRPSVMLFLLVVYPFSDPFRIFVCVSEHWALSMPNVCSHLLLILVSCCKNARPKRIVKMNSCSCQLATCHH